MLECERELSQVRIGDWKYEISSAESETTLSLSQDHAHAPEDAPASALAHLKSDFDEHAKALFDINSLATNLANTADFTNVFRRETF